MSLQTPSSQQRRQNLVVAQLELELELGWEQVAQGLLPYAVAAEQLPRRTVVDGTPFDLRYEPIR